MIRLEARLQIQPHLEAVAKASGALLLLDYDGTLAPFHKKRDQALPYPGIAAVLQEIIRAGHTRVVIVSGREIRELIPLLRIQPLPELWGVHGLQHRSADGTYAAAQIDQRHLDALSDARRWLEYQRLQASAEVKRGSIAVHWRGQTDSEVEEIRGRVVLGWKPIADLGGLDVFEFDGGIEILAPGANKGDVVCKLLEETGPGVPVAYLGDDSSDERAFRAIRDRGLGVLVRSQRRRTGARLWLKPNEVLDFLTEWLGACRRSDSRSGAAVGAVSG